MHISEALEHYKYSTEARHSRRQLVWRHMFLSFFTLEMCCQNKWVPFRVNDDPEISQPDTEYHWPRAGSIWPNYLLNLRKADRFPGHPTYYGRYDHNLKYAVPAATIDVYKFSFFLSESHLQDLEPPICTGREHQRNWQLQRGCPTSFSGWCSLLWVPAYYRHKEAVFTRTNHLANFNWTYSAFCIIHQWPHHGTPMWHMIDHPSIASLFLSELLQGITTSKYQVSSILDPEWSLAPMDPFRVKFDPACF